MPGGNAAIFAKIGYDSSSAWSKNARLVIIPLGNYSHLLPDVQKNRGGIMEHLCQKAYIQENIRRHSRFLLAWRIATTTILLSIFLVVPGEVDSQAATKTEWSLGGAWGGAIKQPDILVPLEIKVEAQADTWMAMYKFPWWMSESEQCADVVVTKDSIIIYLDLASQRLIGSINRIDGTIAGIDHATGYPFTLARSGSRIARQIEEEIERERHAITNAKLVAGPSNPDSIDDLGISKEGLDELLKEAERTHSSAIVILKKGELVGEWYRNGKVVKIEAMSATKSVVSLAIGRLVSTGAIDSLDQPVHAFYPEWKQGMKETITIRHLLNHTSGVQANRTTEQIYASPDFVQFALCADLVSEPGTEFFYNNKATNLLSGIVEKASGKRMDLYLREDLFAALGIIDFKWTQDEVGNPHGMAGLQIYPADFAKLGQLVLNRGNYKGEQLIDESWFDESMTPVSEHTPSCGLLWWLIYNGDYYIIDDARIDSLVKAGVDEEFLRQIPLGRYASQKDYFKALEGSLGKNFRRIMYEKLPSGFESIARHTYEGEIVGYKADGYLGQFLVVYPEEELVGLRMLNWWPDNDYYRDVFYDFAAKLRNITR